MADYAPFKRWNVGSTPTRSTKFMALSVMGRQADFQSAKVCSSHTRATNFERAGTVLADLDSAWECWLENLSDVKSGRVTFNSICGISIAAVQDVANVRAWVQFPYLAPILRC